MTKQMIRRPVAMARVVLVDELPPACGGAVAQRDEDDVTWLLLEAPAPPRDADEVVDMASFVEVGYAVLEAGEPLTVTEHARRLGVDEKASLAVFWAAAREWWQRTCEH